MFSNLTRTWPIFLVLGVLLVWALRPCPEPPEFDPNLVLTTRYVGSWMPFTNIFHTNVLEASASTNEEEGAGEEEVHTRWNGLLIQLGDYGGAQLRYDRLKLSWQGNEVATRFRTTPIWVNVVSENPGFSEPMTADEALWFFPNDNPCEVCCLDEETALEIDPLCLRNKKIHAGMSEVNALITYWRGQNGYDLQTRRSGGIDSRDRFEFDFLDDYRVDLYELLEDEESGTWAFVLQESWTSDEVDQIIVLTAAKPPDDWEKQEPPMPGEGP